MTTNRHAYPLMGLMDFVLFGLARVGMVDWVNAPDNGVVLHLGPGSKKIEGAFELDRPSWDADKDPIPFDSNTVDAIFSTHFMEHLVNPRALLAEAARVLIIGGTFTCLIPHAQSTMFLQDLDHKSAFVIDTWKTLLENPFYDASGMQRKLPFQIGANFTFALAERNTALVTQLVKVGEL